MASNDSGDAESTGLDFGPSNGMPLSRQKSSPSKKKSNKVTVLDEAEMISPLMLPNEREVEGGFNLDAPQPRRPPTSGFLGSRVSSRSSLRNSVVMEPSPRVAPANDTSHMDPRDILAKVSGWLSEEKNKHHLRHARSNSSASDGSMALDKLEEILAKAMHIGSDSRAHSRHGSKSVISRSSFRKLRRQSTAYSSDTDYADGDIRVPSCNATLDNSKTLAYTGGASSSQINLLDESITRVETKDREKDREAWHTFKFEIVRLAHTLRLKGWRKVPMEQSHHIDVERLSGALTNAVYVVSPPYDSSLLNYPSTSDGKPLSRKPPPKLLLRIYGPQVEHLIDREEELQILKRLARKRIGPRLLGTFSNGRFEEFFQAETLKPQDLRNPSTSKQIAMRMRELHEGIELLPDERARGPFIWQNWDKWVDRCERIVMQLDKLVDNADSPVHAYVCAAPWPLFRKIVDNYRVWLEKQYGGEEFLRERLVFAHNDTQYGNILRLKPPGESPLLLPANEHRQLIVIDFEYANANPPGLELANHFTEWCYNYHDPDASWACNTAHYPTLEEQQRFARAYVTHRPQFTAYGSAPGASSTATSPVLRPMHSSFSLTDSPYSRPTSTAPPASIHSIDSPASQTTDPDAVERLLRETRLWRLANSAQWVAWGIVQARVPGFVAGSPDSRAVDADAGLAASTSAVNSTAAEESTAPASHGGTPMTDPLNADGARMQAQLADKRPDHLTAQGLEESVTRTPTPAADAGGDEEAGGEKEEEFEYLSYARERALFFWGDALQLGVVREDELPESVLKEVKTVAY